MQSSRFEAQNSGVTVLHNSVMKWFFFLLKHNPINLNSFYKMDLDLWKLGKGNPYSVTEEI